MSKNLKLFLVFFVLIFVSGWGINQLNLGGTLPAQMAQISQEVMQPVRNQSVPELDIGAESAISVFLNPRGEETMLFEKEEEKLLPVASLMKLMTAKIILENYRPNQIIQISQTAAGLPGNGAGKLKTGQTFRAIDLLYPALMESNNTAAFALAEAMGVESFVELMNLEAQKLGMQNTEFLNPTGLDQPGQHSTVRDVAKLTKNLLEGKSFIWNILSLPEIDLYSARGEFVHTVKNTNELLGEMPSIIGGKTGETPKAQGCLLLVTKAPNGRGYLINIILNSKDRFGEMKEIIDWAQNAYTW